MVVVVGRVGRLSTQFIQHVKWNPIGPRISPSFPFMRRRLRRRPRLVSTDHWWAEVFSALMLLGSLHLHPPPTPQKLTMMLALNINGVQRCMPHELAHLQSSSISICMSIYMAYCN